MRRTWVSIGLLVVLLTALDGCEQTLKQKLRPPPQAEAYNLPPDDPRFQKPIEYPKNTLNKDETTLSRNAKDAKDPNNAPGAGGGGMGGGGMGGMGGMGGAH